MQRGMGEAGWTVWTFWNLSVDFAFITDLILSFRTSYFVDGHLERNGWLIAKHYLKGAFFIDLVRDNLHVVLCMSPIDPRFPERARKFPGLINGPTIDWFLPWPKEALVAVSKGLMGEYPMACEDETKQNLMAHMGTVHSMVTDVCEEYLTQFRRQVYQTPKSYLSFLAAYKGMYNVKLEAIEKQESAVKSG